MPTSPQKRLAGVVAQSNTTPKHQPPRPQQKCKVGLASPPNCLPIKLCRPPWRSGSTASLLKATQHPNTCSHASGEGTPDRWHVRPPCRNIFPTYFQHIFNIYSTYFVQIRPPRKMTTGCNTELTYFGRRKFYTYFQHIFNICSTYFSKYCT